MKSWQGITLFGLVGAAIILYGVHTSLWFLWHSLPEPAGNDFAIALRSHVVARDPLQRSIFEKIPQLDAVKAYQNDVVAFSYAKGANDSLILIPRITSYRSLRAQLQKDGWQVQQWGGLLRARRGSDGSLPPFTDVILAAVKSLGTVPLRVPDSIIDALLPWLPSSDKRAFLMGRGYADRVSFLVADNKGGSSVDLPWVGRDVLAAADTLRFLIPGSALEALPSDMAWDELLSSKLAFAKSTPAIVAEIKNYAAVRFEAMDGGTFVGVEGDVTRFEMVVSTWLSEEERRERPVNRAFRLPDRTIGFERVPGEPRAVLSPTTIPVNDAVTLTCLVPIEDRAKLFFCRDAHRAVVATSLELAQRGLLSSEAWQDTLGIAVGANWLHSLGLPEIASLNVVSDNTTTRLDLVRNEKSP